MRSLSNIRKSNARTFFPTLFDLLVSDEEFITGQVTNIFLVMEVMDTDMRKIIDSS